MTKRDKRYREILAKVSNWLNEPNPLAQNMSRRDSYKLFPEINYKQIQIWAGQYARKNHWHIRTAQNYITEALQQEPKAE